MDFSGKAYEFWYNLKFTSLMFPYIRQELERKYNSFSKIRILSENDPDLAQSLKGMVCVMTGGTRGIGAEVVKVLLRKGCHLIIGSSSKNLVDRQKTCGAIRADVPENMGKLDIWYMNLKSMDSVVKFTDKLKATKLAVNYLIANAGIADPKISLTEDNFEEHFAVNYLSHCLLIDRLIDNLYETSKMSKTESRIVLVSSCAHRVAKIRFNDLMIQKSKDSHVFAYSQSKLAMIMFGLRLDSWLKAKGEEWSKSITINSLHPGICNTELFSHMPLIAELRPMAALAVRSPKEGAETVIYAIISSRMNGISGKYLAECAIEESSWYSRNENKQIKLWNITWKLLNKWIEHNWI